MVDELGEEVGEEEEVAWKMAEEGEEEVGGEKRSEILEGGSKIQRKRILFEEAGEGEEGEEDAWQRSLMTCTRRGKMWKKKRRTERGAMTFFLAPVALVCCDPETSAWAGT